MKLRTGIVALVAAGLTLTACSSGGTEDSGDTDAIASPSADVSGTLKVWLMDGSQPQTVIDAVNAKFNETYPNVKVEVELQQWAGISVFLDQLELVQQRTDLGLVKLAHQQVTNEGRSGNI